MSEDVKGLPVAGYKPTQPPEAIAAVNIFKELEERALRHIETLLDGSMGIDARFMAIGRTDLQMAFMALNRAIFMPGRVKLPEDAEVEFVQYDGDNALHVAKEARRTGFGSYEK